MTKFEVIAYVKKTQKTPVAEIQLAKARREDYMERMKKV